MVLHHYWTIICLKNESNILYGNATNQAGSGPCLLFGYNSASLITREMRVDTVQEEGRAEGKSRSSISGKSSVKYATNTTQLNDRYHTPYKWPLKKQNRLEERNKSFTRNGDFSPNINRKIGNPRNEPELGQQQKHALRLNRQAVANIAVTSWIPVTRFAISKRKYPAEQRS